jgi:hypothetical protein
MKEKKQIVLIELTRRNSELILRNVNKMIIPYKFLRLPFSLNKPQRLPSVI